jgi:hypothetical protein
MANSVHKKVAASTVAAAVTTIIVAVLSRVGVDLTAVEQGAVTTLLAFLAGYVKAS